MGQPFFLRAFLCFDQKRNHAFHLFFHEAVDIRPHTEDFVVNGQVHQPIFFQLAHLDVEDARHQLACQDSRLLLSLLFAAQVAGIRRLAVRQERKQQAGQNDHDQNPVPSHGDSPIPSCCLMMSVKRCSDRSSASEMAAKTPLSSEISRTSGSL